MSAYAIEGRPQYFNSPGIQLAALYKWFLDAMKKTKAGPKLFDITLNPKKIPGTEERKLLHKLAKTLGLPGRPTQYNRPGQLCAALDAMFAAKGMEYLATDAVIPNEHFAKAKRPPAEHCYDHLMKQRANYGIGF